jgi:biopolymer transport protein ExbB/TolQ
MIESLAMFFVDGGIFMYFILASCVVGFAIAGERAFILMLRYNVDGRMLWEKISRSVKDGRREEARSLCSNLNVPLMKILNKGLEAAAADVKDVQNAVDEAALEIIPSIDKRITYLAVLANVATLLGLLGTIQGLIQAFSAVASAEPSQKALLLAKGISVALYTTAFGLIVAIPLLILYSIFQSKGHKIIDEIDEFSVKLVNLLMRGAQVQAAPASAAEPAHPAPKAEDAPAAPLGAKPLGKMAHGTETE